MFTGLYFWGRVIKNDLLFLNFEIWQYSLNEIIYDGNKFENEDNRVQADATE